MKNVMGSLILSALSLSVLSCGKSTGASQSKVQNIFGNDDRVKLTDTDYPWRTIVKIRSTNDASLGWSGCTGTLVGPDLLLTASHCLQDREGKIHSDIRFYPNFIDGKGPYFVPRQ